MKIKFLRFIATAILLSVASVYLAQPVIISQPSSQTVCAGSPAGFTVIASGTNLHYQWRNGTTDINNGGTISGATSATLLISSASFSDALNNYNVVVAEGCAPTVTSGC